MKHSYLFFLSVILLACGEKSENISHQEVIHIETNTDFDTSSFSNKNYTMAYMKASELNSISNSFSEDDFKNFKETFDTIHFQDDTFFIVEGDLFYNEEELFIYYLERSFEDKSLNEAAMIGQIDKDGDTLKWAKGTVLKYAINKNSFRTENEYLIVKEAMANASLGWTGITGIIFNHVDNLDATNGKYELPEEVDFVVHFLNTSKNFIAKSFFPKAPRDRRRILINSGYFTTKADKIGVLRHEIGHIMGFRHEHISKDAPYSCRDRNGDYILDESTEGTFALTPYDKESVMHYFCGGNGTLTLNFTKFDSIGASKLYGQTY